MLKEFNGRIKWRQDTQANWEKYNPTLLDGELIIVKVSESELRFKVGDGSRSYNNLPFQDDYIRGLISSVETNIEKVNQILQDAQAVADSISANIIKAEEAAIRAEEVLNNIGDAEENAQASAKSAESFANLANQYANTANSYTIQAESFKNQSKQYSNSAKESSSQAQESASNASNNALLAEQNANLASEKAESAKVSEVNSKINEGNAKISEDNAKSYSDLAEVSKEESYANAIKAEIQANLAIQSASNAQNTLDSILEKAEEIQNLALESQDSANKAKESENNSKINVDSSNKNALLSQSWAIGGTGIRDGENINNAKYWSDLAQAVVVGGVITFNGRFGNVVPEVGDYTAAMVGADAAGTAQNLINEYKSIEFSLILPNSQWILESENKYYIIINNEFLKSNGYVYLIDSDISNYNIYTKNKIYADDIIVDEQIKFWSIKIPGQDLLVNITRFRI